MLIKKIGEEYGGGVPYCIRMDLCFNTRALNRKEIEPIIFDMLLLKSKPITTAFSTNLQAKLTSRSSLLRFFSFKSER